MRDKELYTQILGIPSTWQVVEAELSVRKGVRAELPLICQSVKRGQLTGGDRFIAGIETRIDRYVGAGGRDWPSKNKSAPFFAYSSTLSSLNILDICSEY